MFLYNYAQFGGAIIIYESSAYLNSNFCKFKNNTAFRFGGAILLNN